MAASVWPYAQVARPDHWFKNVFMLPGSLLVLNATAGFSDPALAWRIPLALAAACLVTSSYYVLNDILDAPFDAKHPVKRGRPIPSGRVHLPIAYAEWVVLAAAGFGIANLIGGRFLVATVALWLMSLVYNVRPIRAKDRTYLDVLVEAVNNPLRLAMGWYATGTTLAVPVSIALAFWMLGGFFMAVKRFAEYRHFDNRERAAAYRASFRGYTEERLLVLAIFCAVAFGLFLGIFLIRYPKFNSRSTKQRGISNLQRQKRSSGTTNLRKPGNGSVRWLSCGRLPVAGRRRARRRWPAVRVRPAWRCARAGCARRGAGRWR